MVIYEVNLETHSDNYAELMKWLPTHIQEVLNMEGFVNAKIMDEISDQQSDGIKKVTINYEIDSIENLQNYLIHHASKMRTKTQQQFGSKLKATRRTFILRHP